MPRLACQRVHRDGDRVLADVGNHHVDTAPHRRVGDGEPDAAGAALTTAT
jgi:hypothetical protein